MADALGWGSKRTGMSGWGQQPGTRHSDRQPWLSWLHASAPKAAAGVASGAPRFLRKQILVQLAASSLLHFLLQSEPSRQELRNRLQFPPAKLNLQRNTNPPTLHATARDPASRRWRLHLQDLTLGGRCFDTKQAACLAVNISK